MFKTRLSALVLAIVMVASMFTAFPAIASAADTWTETYSGDEADFTVSGPTSVTKGETFEITFTFDNFADKVSGFDINLYIDTRYVIYDTTYDANKKEVTPPINLVGTAPATWKLIPNGLTEKAYEEAADKSAASMKGINFSASVSDLANDAFSSAFSVTLRLKAVATGTANFEMGFAYGYNGTRGEFPFFEDGGDNSAFDYAIEVVEEGGDATDTSTSEDTTVDASDVTSDDVTSDDVQEITNIAPEAQYKGEGDDNGTSGSYCEVGAEWNEYHTGKLTDGVIATDASNAQTGLSVEFYNAGFAVGVNKLFFKFDSEVNVSEITAYFNARNNSANRGYPSLVNVYVGDSEDIATATLVGEATTTDEGYVRAYNVKGDAKGTYVIFEMTISNPVAVIALTEVEIMGAFGGSSDDSSDDVTSDDVTSDDVTSDDVTSDDVTSDDVTSDDVTSDDVTSDDVTSDDVTSDDVTSDDVTSDDVSSDDNTSDDVTSDDTSFDDPVVEEIDDMALVNVAGNAQYKGTEGDDNGTSGNYCDIPIGEWLNFHTGKLNDGVIPEGDASATKGQNVEIWNERQGSGYNTVIFKLESATDVKKVNVYMNNRTDNANTGYPEKIEIYVGNDEDMANATYFGEATTTDPEGAVRKHTVSGSANGQYVFIYFTIGAKWRITLSEVEIMTVGETQNIAGYGDYKGTGVSNGTGNYGEANWNEYHDGKLTDGTVAADATNNTTGQNVEVAFNAGFSAGTVYVYNKFDSAVLVNEVIVYMNQRTTTGNRKHPETINIYVGDSEDVATATLLGTATTTDEGYVRAYKATSDKLLKGTYVIVEAVMESGTAYIAFTEIEIMGYGEAPEGPVLPSLDAPVLSGNLTQLETFDAPTISWEAVEGAVSYDAYIDGILVTEGITGTTYVPDMDPVITYAGNTSYTKVQIVAKGDGVTAADSALSESYNFFYVAKPIDLRGEAVTHADILIDVGHGGSQPGACGVYADGSERQEKVDTLNMALKVGEYFESLGYTVAYTRITDTDVGLMARAAMANAGDFKAYICIHRNSFSDARANGIETLYLTGNAENEKFAQFVQDQMIALGGFTNRGLKPRDNLVVLNNTTAKTPLILVELAFISNENDNKMFDEKFDDLALAIVKGTMQYLGDEPAANGSVTVDGEKYDYAGEALEITVDAVLGDVKVPVVIDVTSRLGFTGFKGYYGEMSFDISHVLNIYPTDTKAPNGAVGTCEISETYTEVGAYTYTFTFTDKFGAEYTVATVTVNVTEPEPQYTLGDLNNDGTVDNLDSVIILKYDAGLINLTDIQSMAGDVNGDGVVDNLDATKILKYDAGLIDSLN